MAAYCITDASVINPEEFQKYREQAMPTIEAHGAKSWPQVNQKG